MAVLAAQAKAGFYPTPPEVVRRVAAFLDLGHTTAGVTRMLDPCCGEGEALARLSGLAAPDGAGPTGETYGVELHQGRSEAARQALDHALCSDLFQTSVANGAFHLLYLNPPYDYDDEKLRQEHKFLLHATRYLCPGGVVVFVAPQKRLAVSARYLASNYHHLTCYRFPDPEFADFKQAVVLGVKKEQASPSPAAEEQVKTWSSGVLPPLPENGEARYPVPSGRPERVLFTTRALDPEAAVAEARKSGLWGSPELRERLWPNDTGVTRPLMPLRKGHLAMLIAAGFLNNLTLEAGGQRVLVKGRTYKEYVQVEETEDTETYREVLRTSVVALDLATGEFLDIQT